MLQLLARDLSLFRDRYSCGVETSIVAELHASGLRDESQCAFVTSQPSCRQLLELCESFLGGLSPSAGDEPGAGSSL